MTGSNINIKSSSSLIYDWIKSIRQSIGLTSDFTIQPIVGDASVRKYYLLTTAHNHKSNFKGHPIKQLIIMQTPIDDGMKNFINIANYLASLNLPINVPKIIANHSSDLSVGYLLLSYLGDQLLFKNLNLSTAKSIYQIAWQTLAQIQITAKDLYLLPMGQKYINENLLIFKTWYLETHLDKFNVANLQDTLKSLEIYFTKIFTEQPQVFVHLDYHSKNLILDINTPNPMLGILDFQDAMLGPITYDIGSLLQDAYLVWPEDLTEDFLLEYFTHLSLNSKLLTNITFEQFLKYFYITVLQRHVKNLGIFARLNYLYKKPAYLQYIPNLLNYITKICNKFPEPELVMLKNLLCYK